MVARGRYKSNPFYVSGESYGGVYVPTLAKEVLDHTTINLHGVYVGDPCTDNAAQKDSMDMLWYGHKYGFVPEADFEPDRRIATRVYDAPALCGVAWNANTGDLLHLEGKTWTIRRVTHRKRYRGGRFELYAKIADVTEVSRAAQEEVLSRMLPDSD